MFHDNEQYTLRREIDGGGFTHYYIGYTDEQGFQESRVTRNVFAAYMRFGKDERNLRRWDERHKERLDLSEAEINARALRQPHSIEKILIDAEQRDALRQAIANLPEIQRRRFLMYHEDGMTLEEIAAIENRAFQVIARSITSGVKKLKTFLSQGGEKSRLSVEVDEGEQKPLSHLQLNNHPATTTGEFLGNITPSGFARNSLLK